MLFSSVYVLYMMLMVRRRYELFLVLIPILISIWSSWWFFINFMRLVWDLDYNKFLVLEDISNGLYALSHWIFAAQYLRTSLLLPEMLK